MPLPFSYIGSGTCLLGIVCAKLAWNGPILLGRFLQSWALEQ